MEPQIYCGGLKPRQYFAEQSIPGCSDSSSKGPTPGPSHLRVPSGKLFKGRFLQPSSRNFDSEGLEKRPGNLHCKSAHNGCDVGSPEADFKKQTREIIFLPAEIPVIPFFPGMPFSLSGNLTPKI